MGHTGRFVHVSPWQETGLWTQLSSSIIWDVWPACMFYTGIATIVCCLDLIHGYSLAVPSVMLGVLGSALGFVISYRVHSAYDRFLEGAKLWGGVIHASRNLSRLIWFHVPNQLQTQKDADAVIPESEAVQAIIEKKTLINLITAHAVALKHYLRGETSIYYEDLYALTCFLPVYAMPSSVIMRPDLFHHHHQHPSSHPHHQDPHKQHSGMSAVFEKLDAKLHAAHEASLSAGRRSSTVGDAQTTKPELSRTDTAPTVTGKEQATNPIRSRPSSWSGETVTNEPVIRHVRPLHPNAQHLRHRPSVQETHACHGPGSPPQPLMPSRIPPPFDVINDVFPFLGPLRSLWRSFKRKTESGVHRQRRLRKQKKHTLHDDNLPLAIQLYFSSYVSLLQRRKILDVPTTTGLLHSVQELQNILTDLEKIVTTPIPLAYLIHLKHSTYLYLFFLPFQLERYLNWVTIPAVAVASFIFLGFLGVSAQIEGPFGYDDNDLDLDDYTNTIVAKELKQIVAHPPAGPDDFIFCQANEPFFPSDRRSARQLVRENISRADVEHLLAKGHEKETGWHANSPSEAPATARVGTFA